LSAVIGEERMKHSFRLRSLTDAGVTVAGSSNAPIHPDNPLIGIHMAVVRHPLLNQGGMGDCDS
jgi:predicted amidohydrolase YtcJ